MAVRMAVRMAVCICRFESEFGPYEKDDWVMDFQKYEPVTFGSSYYVATAKIFPVYCEVIAARGVCLEASTTRVTSRTRFHLENAEHARIIAAIAAMPDWFDAPVMTGQE